MKVAYIIPTLFRGSLQHTLDSIKSEDPDAFISICGTFSSNPKQTAINRNASLKSIRNMDFDWVIFVDDDDVLKPGYLKELDSDFDLVVLRMDMQGNIIPKYSDDNLYECNIGINFAINLKKNLIIPNFSLDEHHEDWVFISDLVMLNRSLKHKVTKEIFYFAPKKGNKL